MIIDQRLILNFVKAHIFWTIAVPRVPRFRIGMLTIADKIGSLTILAVQKIRRHIIGIIPLFDPEGYRVLLLVVRSSA